LIEFLPVALRAAVRGFCIIPLHPYKDGFSVEENQRCKRAILPGWPSLATTDPAQIERWAYRYPNANVGIKTGASVVVLESDHLPTLEERLGFAIPPCYTVQARPNRPHFYFLQTERGRDSFVAGQSVAGIFELRCGNQYVLAEGSQHPAGCVYQLIRDMPLFPIPDAVIEGLERIKGAPAARPESDGVAHPAAVEKFVRRFTAYCDRLNVESFVHPPTADGRVFIDTAPCLTADLHTEGGEGGGVGVMPSGASFVGCFHTHCKALSWTDWRRAVEEKHGPMKLEGEIQWTK
jgi:hypothetical protein